MKSKVIGVVHKSPFFGKGTNGEYNGYLLIHRTRWRSGWSDDWGCCFPIGVHGGFTYCGAPFKFEENEVVTDLPEGFNLEDYMCIGWDYAHLDDTAEKYPYEVVKADVCEAAEKAEQIVRERYLADIMDRVNDYIIESCKWYVREKYDDARFYLNSARELAEKNGVLSEFEEEMKEYVKLQTI